jgi:hypothetical protein
LSFRKLSKFFRKVSENFKWQDKSIALLQCFQGFKGLILVIQKTLFSNPSTALLRDQPGKIRLKKISQKNGSVFKSLRNWSAQKVALHKLYWNFWQTNRDYKYQRAKNYDWWYP